MQKCKRCVKHTKSRVVETIMLLEAYCEEASAKQASNDAYPVIKFERSPK